MLSSSAAQQVSLSKLLCEATLLGYGVAACVPELTCQPPLNSLQNFDQSLCLKPSPVRTFAILLSASYLQHYCSVAYRYEIASTE